MAAHEDDLSIYGTKEFERMDVGSLMRRGHPDIVEGDEHIVAEVRALSAGRRLRFADIGSGSGDLVKLLTASVPGVSALAIEPAAGPAAQARAKFRDVAGAEVFEGRFEDWTGEADGFISWGSHHHLPHGYLRDVARRIARVGGTFIIGDEFAPEYLDEADCGRLDLAEGIHIVDGFIFHDEGDLVAYRVRGTVPEWSRRLEDRRRAALWDWYKFVCDYALERREWGVIIAELAIARNDLVTSYSGEHKTSPRLLERELKLAGLEVTKKFVVGDRPAQLQSFAIYTCRAAA